MHVKKLEIHNFMRIVALTIDADGKHVSITGKNSSGKTSTVDCLWAILGGKPTRDMPEPITAGAEYSLGILELCDEQGKHLYTIEKKWRRSGTKLDLTAADGREIRTPAKLIEGMLGRFSLSPVDFLRRKPADQVSDVLTVMGIEPPVDGVKQITGEKVDAFPGETADKYLQRLIGERVGMYYVRRTELNRTADEKKKAYDEATQSMLEVGGPPTAEEIGADATELHHQLQRAYGEKSQYDAAHNDVKLARSAVDRAAEQRNALMSSHTAKVSRAEAIKEQIADLQQELKNCETEMGHLADLGRAKSHEVQQLGITHRDLWTHTQAIPDPTAKIAELNNKIRQAQQQSEQNAKRQQAAGHCQRLQEEFAEAKEVADGLDHIIALIRQLGQKLLGGIDLGIPGLIVGDGELRLDNVSFSQASHAQKLRVACALAMRENPALKVLRIDDGEHLDADSRRALYAIANQHGYQVFITAVAENEEIKVEIVDGEADVPPQSDGLSTEAPKKRRRKA